MSFKQFFVVCVLLYIKCLSCKIWSHCYKEYKINFFFLNGVVFVIYEIPQFNSKQIHAQI